MISCFYTPGAITHPPPSEIYTPVEYACGIHPIFHRKCNISGIIEEFTLYLKLGRCDCKTDVAPTLCEQVSIKVWVFSMTVYVLGLSLFENGRIPTIIACLTSTSPDHVWISFLTYHTCVFINGITDSLSIVKLQISHAFQVKTLFF